MSNCTKCSKAGLEFNRMYTPEEFIEGYSDSPVWIIGLNPKAKIDHKDNRKKEHLIPFLSVEKLKHHYFKDFKIVSPRLYEKMGDQGGVAHTDLIKCFSESWPPDGMSSKEANSIINNCKPHLLSQIREHRPRIFVGNGVPVSNYLREIITPSNNHSQSSKTSYWANFEDQQICIILSGFIGRIDNFAKSRLGAEIELRLEEASSNKSFKPTANGAS